MSVDELYNLVEEYYEYKIKMRYLNPQNSEVGGILYDSFFLKCDLNDRYGRFGAGICFGERKYTVTEFLGKRCSLNSDEESIKEMYLLVYDTEQSDSLRRTALRIAKEKKLKIYNVSAFRMGYADKDLWASSPLEFVRLIRDAKYVVSNSFHATAFSLIFERDFCVINRSERINERMKSLLQDLSLEKRLVTGYIDYIIDPIDYLKVCGLIQKEIDYSKDFLEKYIGRI